ncbi:MAG: cation transporter [Hyphomicrobiaceae bacterium]|nr:cation transporter [Hyphomicrobiaceae bacterium]
MTPVSSPRAADGNLRWTVAVVAGLNLAYFGVEFAVALAIGSVALFADSIDFLEDASVNLLILLGLGMAAPRRKVLGLVLAALILVPSIAALWTVVEKILAPSVANPLPMSLAAAGALAVNATCALLLARVRDTGGSLSKAAFLSARNDVAANVAIIGAAGVTALYPSIWPDVLVGLAIAALNATAAHEVYEAALTETDDASAARP